VTVATPSITRGKKEKKNRKQKRRAGKVVGEGKGRTSEGCIEPARMVKKKKMSTRGGGTEMEVNEG